MNIPPCPRCNKKSYIAPGGKCGECKKSRRICNHCKKLMHTSLAGEWVDGEFLDIHQKCMEEFFICKDMGDMADFVKKQDAIVLEGETNE